MIYIVKVESTIIANSTAGQFIAQYFKWIVLHVLLGFGSFQGYIWWPDVISVFFLFKSNRQ
jgi:hypothetical protein